METKKSILFRIGTIYAIALIGVLLILGKVLYLQLIEGDKWRAAAEQVSQQKRVIPANRGDILADDLRPLASSVPSFILAMDPNSTGMADSSYHTELPQLSRELSSLFKDKSASQYQQRISRARKKGSRYLVLHSKVTYKEVQALKQFPLFNLGKYKGGLILEQTNKRERPYNLLARRTIGYISQSEEGSTVGIEGAFDSYLRGRDGLRHEHRLGGQNWIPVSMENEIDPQDGLDVVSCININYQDVAEQALYDLLRIHNADHGCAVLMEVKTGEIRAMANLGQAGDGDYYELKNYAIWERTEPGSTFKLPALMAALEDGYIDLNDTINTFRGEFIFADQKVTDSHIGGYGMLTIAEVFEKSSNIGMARLIDRYYQNDPGRFIDRLYSMGLKNPTGVEIAGEQKPLIKSADSPNWSKVTLPFMAHGYELLMTPLQILAFYNAVANDGKYVRPKLIRGLRNHSQMVKEYKTDVIRNSICSSETIEKVKSLMEGVVERGTAKNLKTDKYKIAGKTGTAVIAHGDQGYISGIGKKEYRASFVGYFPADRPKYSCIVVITRPNMGVYYGNKVAGAVFREIADKVVATDIELSRETNLLAREAHIESPLPNIGPGSYSSIKTIAKQLDISTTESGRIGDFATTNHIGNKLVIKDMLIKEGFVPDVRGMGLKDALPLLENSGYKVITSGYGKINKQSVEPGSELPKGSVIYLNLNIS
ncbi:MAG: transpeptidase family protein [Bacteroidales bacterium]|nr:transpeptidase family protein [Bacteroidales bacterium]